MLRHSCWITYRLRRAQVVLRNVVHVGLPLVAGGCFCAMSSPARERVLVYFAAGEHAAHAGVARRFSVVGAAPPITELVRGSPAR